LNTAGAVVISKHTHTQTRFTRARNVLLLLLGRNRHCGPRVSSTDPFAPVKHLAINARALYATTNVRVREPFTCIRLTCVRAYVGDKSDRTHFRVGRELKTFFCNEFDFCTRDLNKNYFFIISFSLFRITKKGIR
jgi:hypothetical protein